MTTTIIYLTCSIKLIMAEKNPSHLISREERMFGIFALLSISCSVGPRTPHRMFFFYYSLFFCNTLLRERESCGERHRDHVDVVTEARTGSLGLLYPFSSTEINTSLPYKHKRTFAHTQTRSHACAREPRQRKHAAQQAGGAV